MVIRKAHIYRLRRLTDAAKRRMMRWAGCVRKVWNKALHLQYDALEKTGKIISYAKLNKMLTAWKKEQEFSFLNDCYSQSLQSTLLNLKQAWENFFNPELDAGRPKPKKKHRSRTSFHVPQHFEVNQNNSRIFLPKLGWFKYFNSRIFDGVPKNVTVSEKCGEWYVSIQVEIEIKDEDVKPHPSNQVVAMDLGVTKLAAFSDGTFVAPESVFRKSERKLARAQRTLARKTKFSNNWRKAKLKVAKIYNKIKNIRNDFHYKLTTRICNNHAIVIVENLNVKSMTASAAGTLEEPGTNVKAKSGLNKSILDRALGEIIRQCDYK